MNREVVVCVHGLWVNGMDMFLLRHRLSRYFETHQFSYSSVLNSPAENAKALQAYVYGIEAETVHFVAHSLGGLVVRHLLHSYPAQRPGRIVTLGTPHRGSYSADQFASFPPGRFLLGKSVAGGLSGELPAWSGQAELGSIAGTLRFGMGVLIPGLPAPNDGTVSVAETRLEGMKAHLCLPLSHFGLLFSMTAARHIVNFLQTGKFQIPACPE